MSLGAVVAISIALGTLGGLFVWLGENQELPVLKFGGIALLLGGILMVIAGTPPRRPPGPLTGPQPTASAGATSPTPTVVPGPVDSQYGQPPGSDPLSEASSVPVPDPGFFITNPPPPPPPTTHSPKPSPKPTKTKTPSPTGSPSPIGSFSPSPTPTETPSPTPTETPTPSPTETPSPSPSARPR